MEEFRFFRFWGMSNGECMIEQAPTTSGNVQAPVWRIWWDKLVGAVNNLITTVAGCFGPGQTWQNFSSGGRVLGTTYTNTTSRPIMVFFTGASKYRSIRVRCYGGSEQSRRPSELRNHLSIRCGIWILSVCHVYGSRRSDVPDRVGRQYNHGIVVGASMKNALEPRYQIKALEDAMKAMPNQIDFAVDHCFSPGIYGRALHIPAGSTLVGRVHKGPCLNIVMQGEMLIRMDDGMAARIKAPFVFESKAGSKKAGYAITDTIWMTVHPNPTDFQETDKMEDFYSVKTFEEFDFLELTKKIIAAEKPGFWSDWTEEQQNPYQSGDWRAFSLSRGYSEQEIADFTQWLDMIEKLKERGIDPFVVIHDLTKEAAIKNIKADKKGEILRSSHMIENGKIQVEKSIQPSHPVFQALAKEAQL